METENIKSAVEAILFAAGEPVPTAREQLKALLWKRWVMSSRQKKELLQQIIMPLYCIAFGVLFLFCSLMVWLADPGCLTFGDGMWFSFEAVSTIGFGDIEAAGPIARAATVVLSIFSVFYIALITGVVVNYCSNLIKARQKDTLANFVDSLEHLEEKTPEELAELSARVREYVARK